MAWKIFGYRQHRDRDPWRNAPPWAIEQRNMTVAYNHAILMRLNAIRATALSPEEQRQVDEIAAIARDNVRDMDAALDPDAPTRVFESSNDMKDLGSERRRA